MTNTQNVIKLSLMALIGALLLRSASAADICAVELSVVDSSGMNIRSTVARLVNPEGHDEKAETVADGKVSFCDFGFGRYSIVVGKEGACGTVTLSGIRLAIDYSQTFRVVLNHCATEGDTFSNVCSTYVRVVGRNGIKLQNVVIADSVGRGWGRTDRYGRVRLAVFPRKEEQFTFRNEGYKPFTLRLSCSEKMVGLDEALVELEPEKDD